MGNTNTGRELWLSSLAGVLAALVVGAGEAALHGLAAHGSVVLALRCGLAGLALGLAHALATGLATRRRWPVDLALVAPSLIWSHALADHLAQTATVRALLPQPWAYVLPLALALPLIWLALIAHLRWSGRQLSWPAALVALASGGALLAPLAGLSDLHAPLALSGALAAWLLLQLGALALLRRVRLAPLRDIALLAAGLALISPLLPLPPTAAFLASERSAALRLLARLQPQAKPDLLQAAAIPWLQKPAAAPSALSASTTDLPVFPGRSVLLITVDALRADRILARDRGRSVAPTLEAFARQAAQFTRAYAPSPTSSFSIPALHAGRPMEHLLRSAAPLPETLADRLRAAGYATLALYPEKIFSAGPELLGGVKRSAFGFERAVSSTMEARADAALVRRAVEHTSPRPLFVWVHFYDPHLPYACRGKASAADPEQCYDAEITHVDRELGRLLPWLERTLDDPLVAICADHGEAFGEHGRLYHSTDLYEEQIRVPLLIRVPGGRPHTIPTPVSITDLGRTLLELIGANSAATFPGRDLRPFLIGEAVPLTVTASIKDKRAIYSNDTLKLICSEWPDGPCALHDLLADPGETENLASARPALAAALRQQLAAIDQDEMDQLSNSLPRPIALGRLGRVDMAEELGRIAGDSSSPHRIAAAQILALMRRAELAPLLAGLGESPDGLVRAWASIGLVLLGLPAQVHDLAAHATDPTPLGNWSAVALGRLGDTRGFEPLLAGLASDEPAIRAESALALGELGDRRATAHLLRLLAIKQSRWAAIEALGSLGDPRARRQLDRLRKDDPDQTNGPRYERALARIDEPQ